MNGLSLHELKALSGWKLPTKGYYEDFSMVLSAKITGVTDALMRASVSVLPSVSVFSYSNEFDTTSEDNPEFGIAPQQVSYV